MSLLQVYPGHLAVRICLPEVLKAVFNISVVIEELCAYQCPNAGASAAVYMIYIYVRFASLILI